MLNQELRQDLADPDIGYVASPATPPASSSPAGCDWWNLACQGADRVADAGMSALTESIASGAQMLMGGLVKDLDASATVPLADPTYREVYFGFLGLAAPLIGVILLVAVIVACLRRDAATLGRATAGIAVAGLGGAFYIVFAQLLLAVDDWLSHGVVRVTGYDFAASIRGLSAGFEAVAGDAGEYAANMLIILLMMTMLVAALILWFVMMLRKIAILVVVAFAPLLIAGYLWAPTRRWVVAATEVLIALVFTKTAIYALFGVGLALLSQGPGESLSEFVGATVLMCGACFAPLVMLRLVHFAADTQLAGDAMNTLRGGAAPVTSRALGAVGGLGRHDHARSQGQAPAPDNPGSETQKPLGADAATGAGGSPGGGPGGGAGASAGGAAGGGAGGTGAAGGGAAAEGGAGAAAGAAGAAAAAVLAAQATAATARRASAHAARDFHTATGGHSSTGPEGSDPASTRRGPALSTNDEPTTDPGGNS
jgi:type IV secretion system protein TrbL